MRCLILGGDGMLGHQLVAALQTRHEVNCTLRREPPAYARYGLFPPERAWFGVDARDEERLRQIVEAFRPEAVINAVGIVKQRPEADDVAASLEINALLPHRLAVLCGDIGARLVHISTDCVFDGRDGGYTEASRINAQDIYGRTKSLGEVGQAHCITLRTSIIGPELSRKIGLLEWFLAQRGSVRGYRKAVFSGLSTLELSRVIERILSDHSGACGLWHVSSDPIDKHTLLTLVRDAFRLSTEIVADDTVVCDRSLDSSRFRQAFGYTPPSWEAQIAELAARARERAA